MIKLTKLTFLLMLSSSALWAEGNDEPKSFEVNAITLTRFAIQSLYSPERLVVTPSEVSRTPMKTTHHIPLMYGAAITATPLISWQANGLYVTAIELKNDLNKLVVLDPKQLIGNWQTAAFYPTNELNARQFHETTTVVVTSNRPFGEALLDNKEFVR